MAKIPKAAPDVFVKGGTTSAAWDREKNRQYQQTSDGRAQMGKWSHAVKTGEFKPTDNSSTVKGKAMMSSLRLGQDAHPKILLKYRTGDVSQYDEVLCELLTGLPHPDPASPTTDSAIVMLCPQCMRRTQRQDDAQLIIRRSHRKFHFEPYPLTDPRSHFAHPMLGTVQIIAGEITSEDAMTCTALGCTWKFRIDKSTVYTL